MTPLMCGAGDVLVADRPDGHQFGHWRPDGTIHYTFDTGDYVVVERINRFGIVGLSVTHGCKVYLGNDYLQKVFKVCT